MNREMRDYLGMEISRWVAEFLKLSEEERSDKDVLTDWFLCANLEGYDFAHKQARGEFDDMELPRVIKYPPETWR